MNREQKYISTVLKGVEKHDSNILQQVGLHLRPAKIIYSIGSLISGKGDYGDSLEAPFSPFLRLA